jgi:hypothetical protein
MKPRAITAITVLVVAIGAQKCGAEDAGQNEPLKKEPTPCPDNLDVSGSLRVRTEFFDNFNCKQYGTEDTDNMLLERLRLNFNYRLDDNRNAFIQIQDAHFWFSDLHLRDFGQVCPHQNPLDLREGYIEWKRIHDSPFGFKIGRQTITYRDGRVWGPGDWGNTGRYTWDAIKLHVDTEAVSTDLITAQQVISDKHTFDDTHFDFDAYGIYSRFNELPFDFDVFYTFKYDNHGATLGESGQGDLRSHSLGLYTGGNFLDSFDWGGLGVHQFGDFGEDDINACGLNARLGYTFDSPWNPRFGMEFSYGSGDDDPDDGTHGTFDGVFGGIDRFYGRMNMFAWMNLEDYQASFSIRPRKTLDISMDYHYFRLAADGDGWYYGNGRPIRQDPTGASGASLGHEVDLLAKWNINKHLELFVGYSHFFPESFVRNTGSHDDADWVFFQITLFL